MKKYLEPSINVEEFNFENVITTSGYLTDGGTNGSVDGPGNSVGGDSSIFSVKDTILDK